MIIVKNSKIAKLIGVEGIVLYPFVFFASVEPGPILMKHEMIHVQQIESDGTFFFYTKYFLEYLGNRFKRMSHQEAYRAISYEQEAYLKQSETDSKNFLG